MALPNRAIAFDRRRNMEIEYLQRVRNPRDLIDLPVEAGFPVFGILHHLLDEIAEVQDEVELILRQSALILEEHPAIAVHLAFVGALAADKGEFNRPRIVRTRRGDGAADAAAVAVRVGETVPINM